MSYNTFTPIVTNGLVLYLDAANTKSYPGTGTSWLDLSKTSNNGTLTNCTFNSSNLGSISLNGSNSVVGLGDNDLFSFTSGGGVDLPFSICMWVRLNGYGTGGIGYSTLIIKSQFNGSIWAREWQFGHTNTNGLGFGIWSPDTSGLNYITIRQNSSPLLLNTWYFLTGTYSGSKTNAGLKIYINGVLQTTVNDNGGTYTGMGNTSTTVELGRQFIVGATDNGYLNGNISNVLIYKNKELSASEVLQNYNATKYRFIG